MACNIEQFNMQTKHNGTVQYIKKKHKSSTLVTLELSAVWADHRPVQASTVKYLQEIYLMDKIESKGPIDR